VLLKLIAAAFAAAEPNDAGWLASDVLAAPEAFERGRAAALLRDLARTAPDEVGRAVVDAVTWRPHADPPFAGAGALLPAIPLSEADREAVARELVTWRVHLVLVGDQHLPERLTAELAAAMLVPVARYGEATDTRDWLHLYAAAGGDPAVVVDRLGLTGDAHWQVVVDEDRALDGSAYDVLPLLAHRSPVVRARAAARLEETPGATLQALDRAWRFAPGRQAPLRGPLVAPRLERSENAADRWGRRLVHWARRSSRQSDDHALEAVMSLFSEPTLTSAMHPTILVEDAQALMRTADKDRGPRAEILVRGIDAMLRHVTYEDALSPAPEAVVVERPVDPFAQPGVAFDWEY
jgi:hypothetical protein